VAILFAFTIYRSYILFNRINPNVSKQGFFRDLDKEPPFKPYDYGFDMAFGIPGGKGLDNTYGYYTAY
jgi:hypothetical protein